MRSQNTSVLRLRRTIVSALAFLAVVAGSGQAYAQDKKVPLGKAQEQPKSDKVDISDLENKYWAPKDTDFSVVQNRAYTKKGRFSLAALWGPVINDSWSEGFGSALVGNYYFNERYGVQLSYMMADLKNNATTDQIINEHGGTPDYNKIESAYSVGFNWVPVYAKMSLLGKRIIYFDMAFTPTLGTVNYQQQSRFGAKDQSAFSYGLDVTQYFFLTNHIALRADFQSRWYNEEILKYSTGVKDRDNFNHSTFIMFGVNISF